MNNNRFILTNIDGNKYTVTDTHTGFAVSFFRGRWNTSQKVLQPENTTPPDGQNLATWAASSMRAIGEYMASEHPDLLSFNDSERAHRDLFFSTMQDIGTSLAELRQHNGFSIDEAADRLSTSPAHIQRIESGKLTDKLTVIVKYTEAYGGRLAIIPEESADDPHCQFIELVDE